jgi:dihydropteroate synthase
MTHRSCLAGVTVGDGLDVAVVGALNVSPESFYAGSIVACGDDLLRAAEAMARAGAVFLDVGAMSTAPYLTGRISEDEEADRLGSAVGFLAGKIEVPISADTSRSVPARAALEAGAGIINDVTGLMGDADLAVVVARAGAGLIAMVSDGPAAPSPGGSDAVGNPSSGPIDPVGVVSARLAESLARARRAGIPADAIAIDPGIGFFRRSGMAWHEWDVAVLAGLGRLRALERPICVGVSRKSFLGALTGEGDPARRLPGSLAATTAAVLAGAHMIRTHDVAETLQAVRVAEAVRLSAGVGQGPSS